MRLGGHKMFSRLVLVDLVVDFANSLSVKQVATLGIGVPCGITPSSPSRIPLSPYISQAERCGKRLPVIVFL